MIKKSLYVIGLLAVAIPMVASATFPVTHIDNVKLNNLSVATVSPSSTVSVYVTVDRQGTGSSDNWMSTSYRIESGSYTCVDTTNYTTGTGITTNSFNITAPSSNGTYDVDVRIYKAENCNSGDYIDSLDGNNNLIVSTPPPVNGGWTDWNPLSCPTAPGYPGGNQTRSCTNPTPANGGTNCTGEAIQSCPAIPVPPTPVDGGWSALSCSTEPGSVAVELTATCTNPTPANGGIDCTLPAPTLSCPAIPPTPTPVDGGWSALSCPTAPGSAVVELTSTCTNPTPANEGAACVLPAPTLSCPAVPPTPTCSEGQTGTYPECVTPPPPTPPTPPSQPGGSSLYNRGGGGPPTCLIEGTCPCFGLSGNTLTSCILQKYPGGQYCDLAPVRSCFGQMTGCTPEAPVCKGTVVTAGSSGSQVCSALLTNYLRKGVSNDVSQMTKLKNFLNTHLGLNLSVGDPDFDLLTVTAVNQFQTKYASEILSPWGIDAPTGLVYKTTRKKINELYCASVHEDPGTLTPWSSQ